MIWRIFAAAAAVCAAEAAVPSLAWGQAGDPPVPAPAGRPLAALDGLGFELEVNNDKPLAKISFGNRLTPEIDETSEGGGRFAQWSWSASASAPFGGKDDLTDEATWDKLSDGLELSVGISWFTFSNRDDGGVPRPTSAWQLGAEATVGFEEFEWRTPVTLAKHAEDRTPWSLKSYVNYYPSDMRTMVSFGLEHRRVYEGQEAEIVCRLVVVVATDDCAYASPGGPSVEEGVVASFEWRRTFDLPWAFADLAISPKFSYDADDGERGIELPVYLVPLGKSPVLPGLKVGWSSEDEEWTFGLFLKSSFSLGD